MHHYNFLLQSVKQGLLRGPGRREIGHGGRWRKELFEPVIPSEEEFLTPYAWFRDLVPTGPLPGKAQEARWRLWMRGTYKSAGGGNSDGPIMGA